MSNNKLAATMYKAVAISETPITIIGFDGSQNDDSLYTLSCEDGTCIVLQKTGVNTFEAITED